MRDAGADDIGVHVSSSRVGRPAARWSDRDAYKAERGGGRGTETRIKRREGEREPEAEKGKVGWLGRWSCGAAELRDCGGGWFERGWTRVASREWVGRDVIAMGEIDPGFAVCPRAQQHLHPRDHPSPTTLFHVALQPDSTLRALSLAPSLSLPLSLPLSSSRRQQRRACLEDLSRWLFPRRKRFRRADRVLGMHGEGQNGWPSSWRRCFRLGRMYVGVGFGFLFFSWGLLLFENLFITLHNWWFLNFQVNFSEFCDSFIIIIRYIYVVV